MGGEEGEQGEGEPTQRVVGLVGGSLAPGTWWGGAKGHPTSHRTRWVGLGLEKSERRVKRAGRGRGRPPNESLDLLGVVGGADDGGWGKGPPNESLDSLGGLGVGEGGTGGEEGEQGEGVVGAGDEVEWGKGPPNES